MQHLKETKSALERALEKATAVPWHGALVMATGLRKDAESGRPMTKATPRPEAVKASVAAKRWNDLKGEWNLTLSSLFAPPLYPQDLLSGGTGSDFNAGVLFASCNSFLTGPGSRAWQKLATPEDWADHAATYGILRKQDLIDAQTALREWACNEDDPHTVSTMQAAIDKGMAEAAEKARKAKATKGTTKAKAKVTASKHQALVNKMTPVQALQDANRWADSDLAQMRAHHVMGAGVIAKRDAAAAKKEAKAKAKEAA